MDVKRDGKADFRRPIECASLFSANRIRLTCLVGHFFFFGKLTFYKKLEYTVIKYISKGNWKNFVWTQNCSSNLSVFKLNLFLL